MFLYCIIEITFPELAFVPEWWSELDIVLYMNMDDVEKFRKNHKYILMNHRYEIDWLCGWIICERTGILGVGFKIIHKRCIESNLITF